MYAHYFHDSLDFFADAFAFEAPDDQTIRPTGAELIEGRALDGLLKRFATDRAIKEPRAAATDWSKFFFARLIIPAVVVHISTGRALNLDPAGWRIHARDDGTIARFVFDTDPRRAATDSTDGVVMRSLIDDVVTPLITTLTARSALSPRVFASNAAMYFTWALTQLDKQGRTPSHRRDELRMLMSEPKRPDGGFNPFYAPFKSLANGALDGAGEPADECRRLCCVRDLDPTLELCVNCPRAVTYRDVSPTAKPADCWS